jgi:NADH:ubiquinone oxidoreductase subunit E
MDNQNVTIKICCGTMCYVLGGAELMLLDEWLPEALKEKVHLQTSTCLGYCKDESRKPPFVEIEGECIDQANQTKIIEKIKKYTGG